MALRRCTACLLSSASRQSPPLAGPSSAYFSTGSRRLQAESSNAAPQASTSASAAAASTSSQPPQKQQPGNTRRPPPLPRPLGVAQPPGRHAKPSLRQRAERMLDKDARMQERKHLVKEASTGYFEDYNKLRHEGGKLWVAPRTLIQEKAALYFPELQGTRLEPAPRSSETEVHTSELFKGKISVVAMLSTRISEAHIETYTKPVLGNHKTDPLFQFVQINMQENKLKWALLSLFLGSLRRSIPSEYRSTYIVSTQSLEYLKEPMGMTNKHPGYIYLVDENCKIRWAAVSSAQTAPEASEAATAEGPQPVDEVQALASCIGVLLQRLRESEKP